ncbi:MAG: hypothetical protein ACTSU5_10675 [Promethearchaeota archaeon]
MQENSLNAEVGQELALRERPRRDGKKEKEAAPPPGGDPPSPAPAAPLTPIPAKARVPDDPTPGSATLTPTKLRAIPSEKPPVPIAEAELDALSPLEREVLAIAKKILKLKRYEVKLEIEREETASPMVDKLFATCLAKLTGARGYTKSEIFLALKELEGKNWLVTDERRTKEEVLENDILKRILKLVSDDPGIHARDPKIQEVLGITRNPFTKHVQTLARFGLVVKAKIGKTTNYFPRGFPDDMKGLFALLRNDLALEVARRLARSPGTGVLDLARELGVFHGAVQYHLKKMRTASLVDDDNTVQLDLARRYDALTSVRKILP